MAKMKLVILEIDVADESAVRAGLDLIRAEFSRASEPLPAPAPPPAPALPTTDHPLPTSSAGMFPADAPAGEAVPEILTRSPSRPRPRQVRGRPRQEKQERQEAKADKPARNKGGWPVKPKRLIVCLDDLPAGARPAGEWAIRNGLSEKYIRQAVCPGSIRKGSRYRPADHPDAVKAMADLGEARPAFRDSGAGDDYNGPINPSRLPVGKATGF